MNTDNNTRINKSILFKVRKDDVSLSGDGRLSFDDKFGSFLACLTVNTAVGGVSPRPVASLTFRIDPINPKEYNRFTVLIYIEATGFRNFYLHLSPGNGEVSHAQSVAPNKWVAVGCEFADLKESMISSIKLSLYLLGCPPEALPCVRLYAYGITAEKTKPSFDEGWNTEERIAYCHSGYLPFGKKIAFSSVCAEKYFDVVKDTGRKFRYEVEEIKTNLGKFFLFDFSSLTESGNYRLEIGNVKTESFPIDSHCYDNPILKSLNFLRSLRCGTEVKGIHSACHLNSRCVHPDGSSVPVFGGWHDAGDVSQFEICTAEITHSLCDLASAAEANELIRSQAEEEAKIGLDWLLRTRFGDGYRAMAVTYRVWRKNVLKPGSDTTSPAEEGAFENFLSAAALAAGARVFGNKDPIFGDWCFRSACEDFSFARRQYENNIFTARWGKPPASQIGGAGCLAACELYRISKKKDFLNAAISFAHLVLSCQETKSEHLFKGFFYEDPDHRYITAYDHRGHEQSPVQGLAALYNLLPSGEDRIRIEKALDLHRSWLLFSKAYTAPYNLIPQICHPEKVNPARFTVWSLSAEEAKETLRRQIKAGIPIGSDMYIRIMPIAVSRRGFHAVMLSRAKAASAISKAFGDPELKSLAVSHLEWVLGKNPFASSTMYGEGHNYHPLYVAFSEQIIGALPVGFKTKGDADLPYWPAVCNSVFKEVWGHTTAKFLWILADIL